MSDQDPIEDWNLRFINEWYAVQDTNQLSDKPANEDFLFRHWVIEKLAMLAVMTTDDLADLSAERSVELVNQLTNQ